MLTASADFSELLSLTDSSERKMRSIGDKAFRLVNQGAQRLRATDSYTNRTGNLRGGTQALREDTAEGVSVSLEMDEQYASYVIARGYSNFWDVARLTETWFVSGLTSYVENSVS